MSSLQAGSQVRIAFYNYAYYMYCMEDNLGWLISDVSRHMRRRFDDHARTIGVTRPQWRALAYLARNEGINQGALAELLEVEPITVCRMIDRLEEAGLVERRRDPVDRRAWRLHLTARARPLVSDLRAIGERVFGEAMTGLSPAERDSLFGMLGKIRDNVATRDSEARRYG